MHARISGYRVRHGGRDALTIVEVMVAAGLGAILLIAATSMLSTSMERVHELQEKDLDAKLTGAFALNFKRMARRSAVSAHFWFQSVDLTRSCYDSAVEGGCGFRLSNNQDYAPDGSNSENSEREARCIENVSTNDLPSGESAIQLFANKVATEPAPVEYNFSSNSLLINSYPPFEDAVNPELDNVYAAWKITANTPLSMLTRPYHRRVFFKVAHELRGDTGHAVQTNPISSGRLQLTNTIVLEGSPLAGEIFAEKEETENLQGTVMVAYAAAKPSIFAAFIIQNIWKVGYEPVPPPGMELDSVIGDMIGLDAQNSRIIQAIMNNGKANFVMEFELLTHENLRNFFSEENKLSVEAHHNIASIEEFVQGYRRFNIVSTSFEGDWEQLGEEGGWHKKIHILDRLLQQNFDQLVFVPVELINLSLKSRAWPESGIFFERTPSKLIADCDGCEVRSLMRRPFRRDPDSLEQPLSLVARPILSSIYPKVTGKKGESKVARNKDVLMARKLQGSSMVSIVEVLKDLKCPELEEGN